MVSGDRLQRPGCRADRAQVPAQPLPQGARTAATHPVIHSGDASGPVLHVLGLRSAARSRPRPTMRRPRRAGGPAGLRWTPHPRPGPRRDRAHRRARHETTAFPQDHYAAYFSQIERAAAGLNVTFRRESDVWARAGLTMERVGRFGASEEFEAKWQSVPAAGPLHDPSKPPLRMADRAEAARRYYAICLLEREVLKAAFNSPFS